MIQSVVFMVNIEEANVLLCARKKSYPLGLYTYVEIVESLLP